MGGGRVYVRGEGKGLRRKKLSFVRIFVVLMSLTYWLS
jgi:hypothetical protein